MKTEQVETTINHLLYNSGLEIYDMVTGQVIKCGLIGVRSVK